MASEFNVTFDQLLAEARKMQSIVPNFNDRVEKQVQQLKKFKLTLIEKSLFKKVKIHLSPTFINHMVNELEEYERVPSYFLKNDTPPIAHELHHHLLWLRDASGHAGAIKDQLDATESMLRKESGNFSKHFDHLYLKAIEFAGYLRTSVL